MRIRWYRSYYHFNSVKCVTSFRMSHLLNQTRYLETSFGLISLPSLSFLFLSFHLPCFLFVRLCFLCLIVFLQSSFKRSVLYFDGISQRCFPCDTGGILRGLYNAAEMCFSGVGMTLCDIAVLLRRLILWHNCQFFLMADSDDLLSTVKDKEQACLIFWWWMGWEQAKLIYRNIMSGKVSVCRMHIGML